MSHSTSDFIALAGVFVAIVIAWLDSRRQREMEHKQNIERFASLETKMDPIWEWFMERAKRYQEYQTKKNGGI